MALPGDSPINELQQVQLRAQILVYGALLQGSLPEEPLMVGAFSDTSTDPQEGCWNDGREIWEKAWLIASKRAPNTDCEVAGSHPPSEPDIPRITFPENMPTATRSSLSALYPTNRSQDSQPEPAPSKARRSEILDDTRRKKKAKISEVPEAADLDETMLELEVQQAKEYFLNAETLVASIVEQRKSLHGILEGQKCDQAQLASAAVSLEAAASAASAAVTAASIAYEAAKQAERDVMAAAHSCRRISSRAEQRVRNGREVDCALGIVVRAVSQARTAIGLGNSRHLCDFWRKESDQNRQHQLGYLKAQMDASQETLLSEGVNVEVMPGRPGVWLTAKVLSVKNSIVHVVYNDAGNNHVTEWVAVESSSLRYCRPPRIRFPYPTFDLNEKHEEAPKIWTVGDHVDVHVDHAWKEGVVVSVNSEESNDLDVYYPGEDILENVKSYDLRPSLLWQENKWVVWKCLCDERDQMEKDTASSSDLEVVAEQGETGPSPNHKMRKLIDVIFEESEAQRKRDEMNQVSSVSPAKKRKALGSVNANAGKRGIREDRGKVASKVKKAKRLIERATKPNSLQVSGSRFSRHFMRKLASASASGNSSKVGFSKGHQMLRQLVKLKASPKTSPMKSPANAANKGDAKQQRQPKLIQPTTKLLEELKSALEGTKSALLF